MVLIHFNKVGHLDLLEKWLGPQVFTANVITEQELRRGLAHHPENRAILDADWLVPVSVDEMDDIALVASLRRRWGSKDDRDRGEAEVVALCARYGWTAIMDDEVGRRAAKPQGIACVYMLTAIIAASAAGLLAPDEAWKLHSSIERERRMAILSPDEVHRPVFMKCIEQFRRVAERQRNPEWPRILSLHGLDDLVIATRKSM